MKRVCIFCGSKSGHDPCYAQAAAQMGHALVAAGYALVFGGGTVGLMGVVANAVLEDDGEVTGVIPERLATKELLHPGVSDMRLVEDMHARKALMADLADAFIALPGGYGTLEELFEVITWAQLGIHRKNIGLLNVDGFFDPLLALVDGGIAAGFIKPTHRELFVVAAEPAELLERLERHEMPHVRQWLGPDRI